MAEVEVELPPITYVAIDDLRPHPRNPRRGDLDLIETSITRNGWWGACIVQDREGAPPRILAGEHRWRALRRLVERGEDEYAKLVADLPAGATLPPFGRVPV